MDQVFEQELGDAERVAIFYTPVEIRAKLAAALALDRRLGQIVAQTSEPMLGQMRLAWWREILQKEIEDRPRGDVVLDKICDQWVGQERALIELVDGWEHMLSEPPLSERSIQLFVDGRKQPFLALLGTDRTVEQQSAVAAAVQRWALADVASRTSHEEERELFINLGSATLDQGGPKLPRHYRGLAVLQALARRSLKNGGKPLMYGRNAALVAIRVGIIGR